jgi:DNA-binding response OmpR family regulator
MSIGSTNPATADSVANSDPRLGILSVSPVVEDHAALRQFLSEAPCRIVTAATCDTALQCLERGNISIVVCEGNLPDGSWRNILSRIQTCPETPFLIVTSRLADEKLWAEVLNLGGFDVIAKPFNPGDARHVLETACLRKETASREAAAHPA